LAERLGQPVVVENKPGASSNISIQTVVNAPPDGYTLLFVPASAAVNVSLFENLPFNLLRDIAPVSGLIDFPLVMVANPSLPAQTVAEFIAYAKANPGKISVGSFGTGSTSHVAGELFKMMTGTNMIHVPYRGGAPMVADLVGGQVQVAFDVLTGSLAHVRSGSLRALGMAGKHRSDALPQVPTIGETVAGYEANSWCGVGVPRGTPAEIIERLNREINAGLANPRCPRGLPTWPPRPSSLAPTRSAPTWRPRSRSGARWSACPASGRNDRTAARWKSPIAAPFAITRHARSFDVFQPDTTPLAQALARCLDPPQQTRVVFEPVVKPVVFALESDQHAGRFAVTRNHDLLLASLAQKPRKIVLDLRQWNLPHSRLPNCTSHA